MSNSKKYSYRVVKNRKNWKVEIVRQATSKKTVVSKRQTGFETEADALEWAEKELKSFVTTLGEHNKRKAAQRTERDQKEDELAQAALDAQKVRDAAKETKPEDDF